MYNAVLRILYIAWCVVAMALFMYGLRRIMYGMGEDFALGVGFGIAMILGLTGLAREPFLTISDLVTIRRGVTDWFRSLRRREPNPPRNLPPAGD